MEDAVNLRELVLLLGRHKLLIAATIAVCMILAIIYVALARPVYRAEVVLAAVPQDDAGAGMGALGGQLGGIAALANVSGTGTPSKKDEAVAVLKSRQFTGAFITEQDLLPVLFAGKWDEQSATWLGDPPSISDAVDLFAEEIRSVQQDSKTELITLRVDWTDRELAAAWANLLIERLNEYMRGRDIAESKRSIEYLNAELARTNVIELRQGIFSLIEQQIEVAMLASVRTEYAFRILDPASVPDEDKFAWPNSKIIVAVAFALGLLIALLIVTIREYWSDQS